VLLPNNVIQSQIADLGLGLNILEQVI